MKQDDYEHTRIGMFNASVGAFKTKKAFSRACKRAKVDRHIPENAYGYTRHIEMGDGSTLILIGVFTNNIGIIAHEITHAADMIMQHHGLECMEVRAHMVQHFFDVFYDYLKGDRK